MMMKFGLLAVALTAGFFMEDPIKEVWQQIEDARLARVEQPSALKPPATKEAIDELAKHLGCEIPDQLRDSLVLHDGMEDWGLEIVDGEVTQYYQWLGVDGIRKQWDEDRQRQREAEAEGDTFQVHPKWIPIFIEPVEHDDVIYLDTSNGTILLRLLPSSSEIQEHRYADLLSFLQVLECHIRAGHWYEWGNDLETVANREAQPLLLNTKGIEVLTEKQKDSVVLKLTDGKTISFTQGGNDFANSVLESFKPVQLTRTPGVQNPDHELSFSIDGQSYLVAIKLAPEGKLSFSLGDTQFVGGDPAKFLTTVNGLNH